MTELFGYEFPIVPALAGPLAVGLFAGLGYLLGRIGTTLATKAARRTPSDLDDAILRAVRPPVHLAATLAGAWLALRGLSLPSSLDVYVNRGWIVAATLILMAIGLRLINNLVAKLLEPSPTMRGATGIVRVVGRIFVLTLGGVMILQSLGVAVEPLIASLGIGSLAIGFALKDTLSNLFAGVYLFADRPVRIGDYVKLEGGEEGFVHQIGWRATKIRMLANNMVVVPNSKLAESILTNYDLPESQMSLVIRVGVAYGSDPERVMSILVEEAKAAAASITGMVTDPEPFARFIPGFGDSSLDFSLIVRVQTFVDQYLAQSELRKRIYARLTREGIEIPFPQRTIHMAAGAAPLPQGDPRDPSP